MHVYPKRIGAGVSLLLFLCSYYRRLRNCHTQKNTSKKQEDITYANIAYMYVAQGTPFLYERAHLCRVYIHVIVGVHCHFPLNAIWKFLSFSVSEAKRSKRLILKDIANPQTSQPASLCQPSRKWRYKINEKNWKCQRKEQLSSL